MTAHEEHYFKCDVCKDKSTIRPTFILALQSANYNCWTIKDGVHLCPYCRPEDIKK